MRTGTMALAGAALTAAVAALLASQATGDPAANVAPKDRAAIEAIVRDYILKHPEIIPEAIAGAETRTTAKAVGDNRKALETPFAGASAGPVDGDVRLVVFFDYACPYCQASAGDVTRLLATDKRLKVVFRDFPVLGDASNQAALASLSAAKQGKYLAFHDQLFAGSGRITPERAQAAARAAGLDLARVKTDLTATDTKAEVAKNLELGRILQLTGTPSYIVGDKILAGAVGYDALKAAVAAARAKG